MTVYKKLYKNYAYSSIYQILILILPLILTPFLTRVLGADGIGQYSYTRSIVTYFILFGTLGSNMYAQREIAYVSGNRHQRSRIFQEILLIRCLLLNISLIVYLLGEVRNGRYPLLFLIQSMDIIAAMVDITWYFQGMENFRKITLRNTILKLFSAVFILAVIRKPSDLWLYVFIYTVSNLLGQIWLWKDAIHTLDRIPFRDLQIHCHWKNILMLFIPQVAIQIYLVIDKTMIQILTNDSLENGYYELAQTIQRAGVILTTAFGSVTASRIALLKSKSGNEEIRKLITQSYEIVCLIGVPIAMGLGAIARNLIPWFMGDGYMPVAQLLIMLCPLIVIIGFSNISGIQYMIPMGLQSRMTASTLSGMAVNVVLNLLWIPDHKAKGAAAASVIAECAVAFIQLISIREVPDKKVLLKSFALAVFSGCIMVILIKIAEAHWLEAASFQHTLLLTIGGGILYFTLQFLLGNRLLKAAATHLISIYRKRSDS